VPTPTEVRDVISDLITITLLEASRGHERGRCPVHGHYFPGDDWFLEHRAQCEEPEREKVGPDE
jgi:hypothetical protein